MFKINGIYELPFGPGEPFLSSTNGVVSRIAGYTANFSAYTATHGVVYLPGFTPVADPSISQITSQGSLAIDSLTGPLRLPHRFECDQADRD